MAARRALVRIGGKLKQLPAGDAIYGIPIYAPATQQDGTLLKLALNIATYTLSVTKQGGTTLAVSVAING